MQKFKRFINIFIHVRDMSSLARIQFTKEDIQAIIPPLKHELHKGQCGRIGVIGGSREYTGAPYFAAMTALRLGADLAHVFCSEAAGTAIKGYSPDLIVHPILDDDDALEQIKTWLPRLHAVVVGPGLGRDNKVINLCQDILKLLKNADKLTIIDADGLHTILENPDILTDFTNAVVTPNAIEYKRLLNSLSYDQSNAKVDDGGEYLSECFKDLTVVKKGHSDQIFYSQLLCEVDGGSSCRCGGQGDVLSGAIALFSYWAQLANSNHKKILGAYCGCYFTRHLNKKVFEERGRSMVTGDFIEKIGVLFNECFPQ